MRSPKNLKSYYFFIGTEAEFIKVFPVLQTCERRNIPYRLLFSGQNNLSKSQIIDYIQKKQADIVLSDQEIPQTSVGLLSWFVRTSFRGFFILRRSLTRHTTNIMVVHGDTVSTVMGAILGRLLGMKIAHLEAGLRSFSLRQPFPEEIDRLIVSRLADLQFCPNDWAMKNLNSSRAKKINTQENTLIESLTYVLDTNPKLPIKLPKKYFVFVLHRQENLLNKQLVMYLIRDFLLKQTDDCVFLMHAFTKEMLDKYGLLTQIKASSKIYIADRMSYAAFMQVLKGAEFVITDGGSNQEECYYLGIPTLLLRNVTERIEGLGENVVISKHDLDTIRAFILHINDYRRQPVNLHMKPSDIIVDYLEKSV